MRKNIFYFAIDATGQLGPFNTFMMKKIPSMLPVLSPPSA
jgi:hypothetical protein